VLVIDVFHLFLVGVVNEWSKGHDPGPHELPERVGPHLKVGQRNPRPGDVVGPIRWVGRVRVTQGPDGNLGLVQTGRRRFDQNLGVLVKLSSPYVVIVVVGRSGGR
jgi:hypothetical protein